MAETASNRRTQESIARVESSQYDRRESGVPQRRMHSMSRRLHCRVSTHQADRAPWNSMLQECVGEVRSGRQDSLPSLASLRLCLPALILCKQLIELLLVGVVIEIAVKMSAGLHQRQHPLLRPLRANGLINF